ncbi:MAG: response regulator [Gammaproteobacteria bacterium]
MTPDLVPPKAYLTSTEVANLLMVAPVTVRSWAQKGLLRARSTPGGHRRYLRHDVERFAAAHRLRLYTTTLEDIATRVLVVDDDVAFAGYLATLLALHGAVTETASNGFSAGRALLVFQPDVVLLDVRMPGMDGVEVCEAIKGDPITRDVRVIGLTGLASPENVARLLAAGAERCLAKPVPEAELLALLGLPQTPPAPAPGPVVAEGSEVIPASAHVR